MSHAGWGDLWTQALALLSAEPVHLRILTGLGAAFCALIFVEGLRACFLPAARKPAPAAPLATTMKPKPKAAARVPFRPRMIDGKPVNRKKPVRVLNRARAELPQIRRRPALHTSEGAPYSPVPSSRH